ncbi:MAG: sodium:solute symporter [Chitinophagaceae bacterium]|jgi:Na+/proline symporter|nr:sodium:solute symporter [Chitinophagaceae bacterium]
MSSTLLFIFVLGYFLILLGVAWVTSRNSTNESFFIGNRSSNWVLVAFGMIGTSLSGVTFVSVPGTVGDFGMTGHKAFTYYQVVIGYVFGYAAIAYVLIPLFYRMNLTSIYHYLEQRLGRYAYKTGALFFIISRTVGATARLYLVINVLQIFILNEMGVPFIVTAFVILLMILLYTFEGGVKTIVYTDTLQTSFMLLGLVVCIGYILTQMDLSFGGALQALDARGYTRIFEFDPQQKSFFLKQLVGGAVIALTMTGLDQEMMQKNISVRTMRDSQKNILTFTTVMVVVNFLFLLLGGLLYLYMIDKGAVYDGKQLMMAGRNIIGDDLFPYMAMNLFPQWVGIVFIIALISALFPSADGALTALTSSFCIDILGIRRREGMTEKEQKRTRMTVHLIFTMVFMLCILVFKWIDNKSIINVILELAGYTYGPLLGLFFFGILTRRTLRDDGSVPLVCLASPVLCYFLSRSAPTLLGGYQIGLELLLINGLITFSGLWLLSRPTKV